MKVPITQPGALPDSVDRAVLFLALQGTGLRNRRFHRPSWSKISKRILVLLVNDSEYSKSKGAKPIPSHGCIYLVFRARAAALPA
jgi:hypothetical protein